MKKLSIAVLLSTAVISSAAFASDQGFYVGGNVGQASTNFTGLTSKTATAVSVLGGYQINKNFAVEAQYGDFGSITPNGGTSAKITEYGVSAVGMLPFSDQWTGLVKLGYANTSIATNPNTSNNSVSYGLGVQYNVNQQLGVRAGYDAYKVGGTNTNNTTATTGVASVGVVYKF
ncbi:MAG: porin family protein [Gallionella sp.]|nr:porin family protein [Gallionella sp.]